MTRARSARSTDRTFGRAVEIKLSRRNLFSSLETDTADRLRRALLEAAFTEAAALVGADLDAQEAEEAEELDDDNVVRANFADFEGPERPEAA